MEVSVATRPGRGCVVVQVGGDLDLATTPEVQRSLDQVLAGEARAVVLDLTGVRFIDSTALGMMVWLHKELQQRGGYVRIAAPQPLVLKVLELTSIDRLIPIHDSVEAAEDDLPATG